MSAQQHPPVNRLSQSRYIALLLGLKRQRHFAAQDPIANGRKGPLRPILRVLGRKNFGRSDKMG